jgi:type IV pilus assembly protein PilM
MGNSDCVFLRKQMIQSIGIDIGHNVLKLVQVQKKGRTYELCDVFDRELPTGWEKDKTDIPIQVLTYLFKEHNLDRKHVVLALPATEMRFETCSVPFTQPEQIARVIKYESEQYIAGWPIEETLCSYFPIKREARDTQILLIAVHKARIKWWLNLADKVGLDPCIICPDIVALTYSLLLEPKIAAQDAVLLVDIGAASTNMVGLEQGQIRHLRVIRTGTRFFRERPNTLDPSKSTIIITAPETSRHKHQRFCQRMIREIQRTLLRFKSPAEKIYLTGGGSLIPDFTPTLQNALDVPCEKLRLPETVACYGDLSAKTPLILSAVGLAIAGLDQIPDVTDFRKEEFVYTGIRNRIYKALAVFITLLFIGLGLLALSAHFKLKATTVLYQLRLDQALEMVGHMKEDWAEAAHFEKIGFIAQHLQNREELDHLIPVIGDGLKRWAQLAEKLRPVRTRFLFTIERLDIRQHEIILAGRLANDTVIDIIRKVVLGLKYTDPADTETKILSLEKIDQPKFHKLKFRYRYRIGLKR